MRWSPGFLCNGEEFEPFWTALGNDGGLQRRGLLIAGRGFDPRTTAGPQAIARTGFPIADCWLIRMKDLQESPDRPRSQEAADHEAALRTLYGDVSFELKEIAVRDPNGRLVGSAQVRALLTNVDYLRSFTDVIVDITALPASVSFPLLGALITIYDELRTRKEAVFNLHCIICENPYIDERIVAEGGDVAEYIDPFRGRVGRASEPEPTTIWAPVLGQGHAAVLRKIEEMLRPVEVKPFLPSPSRNPRRGDELIAEYHSLLFDTWGVDPRGIIYADERDPFDVYRQLGELAADYGRSLAPLGFANTVVSTHSSKVLSLGVLLAAFEHELAIAHVEPTQYSFASASTDLEGSELFEIWLTGEAYG